MDTAEVETSDVFSELADLSQVPLTEAHIFSESALRRIFAHTIEQRVPVAAFNSSI